MNWTSSSQWSHWVQVNNVWLPLENVAYVQVKPDGVTPRRGAYLVMFYLKYGGEVVATGFETLEEAHGWIKDLLTGSNE